MRPSPLSVEAFVWFVLIAGVTVITGLETDWWRKLELSIQEPANESATFSPPTLAVPFEPPAIDRLLETALRPLFVATRRPAPYPLPPQPPKPSMAKGQFLLSGTTIVPEGRFAQLVQKSGNKSISVAEGEMVNGILVKTISPESVVLTQHDDSEVLTLVSPKSSRSLTPRQNATFGASEK